MGRRLGLLTHQQTAAVPSAPAWQLHGGHAVRCTMHKLTGSFWEGDHVQGFGVLRQLCT